MNTKLFANPFYCYIISFGLVLFIYSWGWSRLYPELTDDVVLFLIGSFVLAFGLGKSLSHKLNYSKIPVSSSNTYVVLFVVFGYLIEFIFNGGVPLFLVLKGVNISYMEFGIPTFHVLLHTLTNFFAVYIFHQYISSKNKILLVYLLVLIFMNILTVNRGAVIMTVTACIVLYLLSIKRILAKRLIIIFISGLVFFYGFGYLGNVRSFNGDSQAFLRLTLSTDEFRESSIPKEFYWFYIYASSPLANFENAVTTYKAREYDPLAFVAWELLPDFISKRLIASEQDKVFNFRVFYQITPILTVGSIYFDTYLRLSWLGPIIVFLYYCLLTYLFVRFFPEKSKYFMSFVAVLCVISIFNIFDNMLNFSGLSMQLIFPLIFSRLEKYKFVFPEFKKISFKFK